MMRAVVVRRYPQGPRVWVCGQRVHHGASGLILAGLLARRRRRLAALALAWAATDWHDWRVWFVREGVPAGELVSALTAALDSELSKV